ncbi:response regulator transcription factor [Lederbergia lenta]|uniref:Two-component response regulator n=1 Tax=Lederbergia lenta TaxID=1467 RepID=A0A2X4WGK2_LEDLE|nr:response regulator [Lederbergia lenta]MCM3112134.1 response regulator [Lederbergia lenta]MEC2323305.1 response regulator [Lederbergia lenta]SQI63166.1 two-component response regulator [Lederbergia lenta]
MFKVVIADDEYMIKKSLAVMIESSPFNFKIVGEADDGSRALDLVKEFKADLLVTDIRMPVMDGLELIEMLHKESKQTEVIVVSGFGEFEYAQKALRLGAIDYLLKPVKVELVLKALKRVNEKLQTKDDVNGKIRNAPDPLTNLSPKIIQAVKFINENFNNENVSLQLISDYVELSPAYFSRTFKEETGSSFVQYLTKMRMEKAKILLGNPYFKSYEVADAVGYIDYSHFSKAFKKYNEISPNEYRRKVIH